MESPQASERGFHPHRAPRGDRDHCDLGGNVVTGTPAREGEGQTDLLYEQLAPVRGGFLSVCRRQRWISSTRRSRHHPPCRMAPSSFLLANSGDHVHFRKIPAELPERCLHGTV